MPNLLDPQTKQALLEANRRLQEERAQISTTLESIGDAVLSMNQNGYIVYVNPRVEEITGFTKKDLIGKFFNHAFHMVDERGMEVPIKHRPIRNAFYHKKRVTSNRYFYLKKNGSKFPVSVTATPVLLYDQIIGAVNVFRDITREYEIDKMKTEFISLASHQLRTPLSAMKWFSEILLEGDAGQLTQEQKEMVENIYKSNERMIELVNTLLNISRIESGRIIIDPKPTDIRKLVDEVILELQPRLKGKRQNLAISVHHELPLVNIDPKLIRHVYMNLLTNAIKYSPDGGEITIIISKSGNEIISQITDTGYGIPEDQQERVFQKFFRARNVVKKETDGTGLGLYLTYAIVQSSGGKIWYQSKENAGTTFWFVLPITGSIAREGEVSIDS